METLEEKAKTFGGDRRSFLKNAGVGAVAAAFILSCKKKDDDPAPEVVTPPPAPDSGVNLGSGDVGILNYAFALEQLEAAFYTLVVANAKFTTIFSAGEQEIMIDIKAHEIVHREFFRVAIPAANRIPDLEVNFSAIKFDDRADVLKYASIFEELGVKAYNGAGHLITSAAYLTLAGKIVSVEARHASAINDLISPNTVAFAPATVDGALMPMDVLTAAQPFIKTKINGSNLPKS